jgi:hypothetical protein
MTFAAAACGSPWWYKASVAVGEKLGAHVEALPRMRSVSRNDRMVVWLYSRLQYSSYVHPQLTLTTR